MTTPTLTIHYNTDDYYEPDADDLKSRYITSITDQEDNTWVFTDSGYFRMPQDGAEYLVTAVNHHAMLVEALHDAAGALGQLIKDNEYSRSLDLPAIDTATYDLALQHARKALAAVKGDQ